MSTAAPLARSNGVSTRLPGLGNVEDKRPTGPRKPLQKRSRERFQRLLDATDGLLAERDVNDVGLYDIAKRSKVPPPSVYHFFPTKEAAFVALAERYLERLYELTRLTPLDRAQIRRWPDLFALSSQRAVQFYNQNPVLLKIFFGGGVSGEIRQRDVEYVRALSAHGYGWMNQYFIMPYLPDAETRFSVIWSIYDGVTMTSYLRHGYVTPEFHEELLAAVVAYGRTFLPEVLPVRPPDGQTS